MQYKNLSVIIGYFFTISSDKASMVPVYIPCIHGWRSISLQKKKFLRLDASTTRFPVLSGYEKLWEKIPRRSLLVSERLQIRLTKCREIIGKKNPTTWGGTHKIWLVAFAQNENSAPETTSSGRKLSPVTKSSYAELLYRRQDT